VRTLLRRTLEKDARQRLRDIGADSGAAQFAVSRDGTLAYIPGEFLEQGELLWVYRDGRDPEPVWPGKKVYGEFAVSPGGDRLAIALRTGESNVWIYDIDRKVPTRLTFEGENRVPVWSSDGKQIYYRSYRNGKTVINRKPADGGGKEELLGDLLGEFVGRPRSVRGQVMLFTTSRRGNYDISALYLDTGQVQSIVASRHLESFPFLSPDGQRLAYSSSKTERTEVYVCPFPDGTPPVPISSDGGEEPQWSADGAELFYRNQDEWMVVDMTGIKPGPPQLLFQGPYLNIPGMSYDYAPPPPPSPSPPVPRETRSPPARGSAVRPVRADAAPRRHQPVASSARGRGPSPGSVAGRRWR